MAKKIAKLLFFFSVSVVILVYMLLHKDEGEIKYLDAFGVLFIHGSLKGVIKTSAFTFSSCIHVVPLQFNTE